MIEDKYIKFITSISDVDIYEYSARFLRYFYCPMAYYETLLSRKIRETLDFVRGDYRVFYIARGDKMVGCCTIVKGGGRYRFCSKEDRVFCNLFIREDERKKGYSSLLVSFLTEYLQAKNLCAFIRHNNTASIKCFLKLGYVKVADASYNRFHVVSVNPKGHLGIYSLHKG